MPLMYWFSRRMTLWGSISFNLAVFINIIIAFFYPYVEATSMGKCISVCCCLRWKKKRSSVGRKAGPRTSTPPTFILLLTPKAPSPFCWPKEGMESRFQWPALLLLPS